MEMDLDETDLELYGTSLRDDGSPVRPAGGQAKRMRMESDAAADQGPPEPKTAAANGPAAPAAPPQTPVFCVLTRASGILEVRVVAFGSCIPWSVAHSTDALPAPRPGRHYFFRVCSAGSDCPRLDGGLCGGKL